MEIWPQMPVGVLNRSLGRAHHEYPTAKIGAVKKSTIVSDTFVSKLSCLFGPSDRIRTCGILLPKQARYQLRYTRIRETLYRISREKAIEISLGFAFWDGGWYNGRKRRDDAWKRRVSFARRS